MLLNIQTVTLPQGLTSGLNMLTVAHFMLLGVSQASDQLTDEYSRTL